MDDIEESQTLDLKSVTKLTLSLKRRLESHTAARRKEPDVPFEFLDSGEELVKKLKELKILAGEPLLYPYLVRIGMADLIAGILKHESEVSIAAVTLLRDLMDAAVVEDYEDCAQVLVKALVDKNTVELIVQNLIQFDESLPFESDGIYTTLWTIENLVHVEPCVSELLCEKTNILSWLQARIIKPEFDGNKQYACEILAILLLNTVNQKRFGQMKGVDTLLQAIKKYKFKELNKGGEKETVTNLFCCLSSLLMLSDNKESFVKLGGVDSMLFLMDHTESCYRSAINALDCAMTNYPPACERFMDGMGLKFLLSKKNEKTRLNEEEEKCHISLLASLFGEGVSRREILLLKFMVNTCEKLDRLMELYTRYYARVKAGMEWLSEFVLNDLEIDEDKEYTWRVQQVSRHYTLQLIALIMGHLWISECPQMRERIGMILDQQKLPKVHVAQLLKVYHDNIGDLNGPEEKEKAQSRIMKFISAFRES